MSTLQAGAVFGALCAYWVADKYGRRAALFAAAVVALVGTVMQTVSLGNLPVMYVGRLVTGLAVGAASMLNPLYTSENAPRAIRGALTGMYQFFVRSPSLPFLPPSLIILDRYWYLRCLLDQLWQSTSLFRRRTVHHPTSHAMSPCGLPWNWYAHLKRVPALARTSRPVGRSFFHPRQSPQPPGRSRIRAE